jgi:hypothetical protein
MKVVISACSNKAFSYGLMPLAHLKLRPLMAVNDNNALFSPREAACPLTARGQRTGAPSSSSPCLPSLLASSRCFCFKVLRFPS